jgi:hypothetical protein
LGRQEVAELLEPEHALIERLQPPSDQLGVEQMLQPGAEFGPLLIN